MHYAQAKMIAHDLSVADPVKLISAASAILGRLTAITIEDFDIAADLVARAKRARAGERAGAKRIADRIDGYDRDGLGESPDY